MKFSKEDFDSNLQEGQNALLELLAHDQETEPEKFFKVAQALEYIQLFSGILYSMMKIKEDNKEQ